MRRGAALFLAAFVSVPSGVLEAQSVPPEQDPQWFGDVRPFDRLVAAPREVQFRGSFVAADRDSYTDFEGRNIEAEVAVGIDFPVVRLNDAETADGAVVLTFDVGIWSRFYMEAPTKDLINVDYRVAFPIEYRGGPWQLRAGYRHLSSHAGDDFLARDFGGTFSPASKDGFEGLLGYKPSRDTRIYAGGDWNFHVDGVLSRGSLRGGFEWDAATMPERSGWPYLAVDFEYTTLAEDVGTTVTAGGAFRAAAVIVRVEARAHFGPTFLAQLREVDESFFGVGLHIEF